MPCYITLNIQLHTQTVCYSQIINTLLILLPASFKEHANKTKKEFETQKSNNLEKFCSDSLMPIYHQSHDHDDYEGQHHQCSPDETCRRGQSDEWHSFLLLQRDHDLKKHHTAHELITTCSRFLSQKQLCIYKAMSWAIHSHGWPTPRCNILRNKEGPHIYGIWPEPV